MCDYMTDILFPNYWLYTWNKKIVYEFNIHEKTL